MGSGMTAIQLGLIEAIAKNDQKEIKKLAIACCNADDTKKNQIQVQYLKNLLKKQPTLLELPANISHIVTLQDMSDFREDELPTPMRCIAPMEVVSGWQQDTL